MIEISCEQLEKVNTLLSDIKGAPQKVLHNAINRGLNKVKTVAAKDAASVYTVSTSTIKSAAHTKQKNATSGSIVGSITFSGHKLPLKKFKVSGTGGQRRKAVSAIVKKGSGGALLHAYVRNLGNGAGVFERKTSKRESSETLMALSAAQMIGNDDVLMNIEHEASEVVEKRIEHEISRILAGIGV